MVAVREEEGGKGFSWLALRLYQKGIESSFEVCMYFFHITALFPKL